MKFDVIIDFESHYIDGIEAKDEIEAKKIALVKYNSEKNHESEICNIEITPTE